MVAPVVVRRFAAVQVATNHAGSHILNYQRLVDTIELFKLFSEELVKKNEDGLLTEHMRDMFPTMSPYDIQRYLSVAHECFIHGVTP